MKLHFLLFLQHKNKDNYSDDLSFFKTKIMTLILIKFYFFGTTKIMTTIQMTYVTFFCKTKIMMLIHMMFYFFLQNKNNDIHPDDALIFL